jgi:DNA-binding NtrC family response regulator
MISYSKIRILIIDDEPSFNEELSEFLTGLGTSVKAIVNPLEALEHLKSNPVDIIILDIKLPQMNGIELLKTIRKDYPFIEVIMVTGHGDLETVIESLRLGACDFLKKPFRHLDIQLSIERTRKFLEISNRLKRLDTGNSLLSSSLKKKVEYDLIGISEKMQKVYELSKSAASFDRSNVLITGESGSGKEIIARIIHFAGKRREHHFCPVNCSAIPSSLLESVFFGHKKGSFTGAISDQKGYFELADQGTIFLDEIGDMPIELEAKILRAIESKMIKKIGDQKSYKYDFRIISATNRNIEKMVKAGEFRLDLLHRLNTIQIHIPPLRERVEDIPPLVDYFIDQLSSQMNLSVSPVNPGIIAKLKSYHFPGNVRELKNLIERAIIISGGSELKPEHFILENNLNNESEDSFIRTKNLNLEENEKSLIMIALEKTHYNYIKAAEILGISRHALSRRLKKYKIID